MTMDKYRPYMGSQVFLPFIEGDIAGVQTQDYSRHGIHGTLSAARQPFYKKAVCEGIVLDGVDDYVNCTANGAYDFGTLGTDFSLVARVTLGVIGAYGLVVRGAVNVDGYRLEIDANGAVHFRTYQAAAGQVSSTANGAVTVGEHEIAVTYAWGGGVGSAIIYVDGVDVTDTSGNHIDPLGNAARVLYLGRFDPADGAGFLGGLMPWARIYNDVMTPAEVLELYEGYRTADNANIVGWWDLERGWGDQAYDRSATGADGTIYSGATATPSLWYTPGSGLVCMDFAGYGPEQVSLGAAQFDTLTDMTLTGWFWLTNSEGWHTLFSHRVSGANRVIIDTIGAPPGATLGKLKFSYLSIALGNSEILSDSMAPTSRWVHVACCLGSGGMKMWLNGQLQTDTNASEHDFADLAAAHGASNQNDVGGENNIHFWMGKLVLFNIVNRVLTHEEILSLFNGQRHLLGV